MFWLESVLFTDLSSKYLIDAALQIGQAGNGSITLQDIVEMTYDDLRYTLKTAKDLIKMMNGEKNGEK